MKPWIPVAIAIGAIVVGVENYLLLGGGSDVEIFDDDEEEFEDFVDDADPREALPSVAASHVTSFLALMPEPPPGRNPFVTQAEADRLAIGGSDGGGGVLPTVRGTLWSPERRVAWIGPDAVVEGDVYQGVRVEKIEPDGIWVRSGERSLHIPVTAAAPELNSLPASADPNAMEAPEGADEQDSTGGDPDENK